MGKQEEMDFNKTGGGSKSDSQPLSEFVEKAYLDYSMYVILDRALPVHRRWPKTCPEENHICHV